VTVGSEIGEFAPITEKIRKGLAESKARLAWCGASAVPPCQMELTAAFLPRNAKATGGVALVVKPAPTAAHIELVELRDARYAAAPTDADGCDTPAQRWRTTWQS